jgi:hypothetical protein
MTGESHPCRLDFKNCTYTLELGPKKNCVACNPHTPPAPVDSSIRPGAGAATTPRVEAIPQPPRGVSDGDAAERGGEAAPAAPLQDLRRRWVR